MVQAREKFRKKRQKREKELQAQIDLLKKKQKVKSRKQFHHWKKAKAITEGFRLKTIHQKSLKSEAMNSMIPIKVDGSINLKKGSNTNLTELELFNNEFHKKPTNNNLMDKIKNNSNMKKIISNYILLKFRNEVNYGRP